MARKDSNKADQSVMARETSGRPSRNDPLRRYYIECAQIAVVISVAQSALFLFLGCGPLLVAVYAVVIPLVLIWYADYLWEGRYNYSPFENRIVPFAPKGIFVAITLGAVCYITQRMFGVAMLPDGLVAWLPVISPLLTVGVGYLFTAFKFEKTFRLIHNYPQQYQIFGGPPGIEEDEWGNTTER